jgi:hypothetical protein
MLVPVFPIQEYPAAIAGDRADEFLVGAVNDFFSKNLLLLGLMRT